MHVLICNRAEAGAPPGCCRPAAAVFIGWITSRVCCRCNSLCLNVLTSSSRWWLSAGEFSSPCDLRTCLWIKVDVKVMRLHFFFMWQVIDLRRISLWGESVWTHVGGWCCPTVFWNSVAWCSFTENKKKNEIWLLWHVDMFSMWKEKHRFLWWVVQAHRQTCRVI